MQGITGEKGNIHKTLLELFTQAHFFFKSYYITALYNSLQAPSVEHITGLSWATQVLRYTTFNIN